MSLRYLLVLAACALFVVANGQSTSLEDNVTGSVEREAMARMLMDMGSSMTVNTSHPCFMDSTNATACNGFALTDAEVAADIHAQCGANVTGAMSWMIGCTLRKLCVAGEASGPYCSPFSILADLCVDMPGMGGCKRYNMLCSNPRSVVQQCTTYQAIPRQTQRDIMAMCADHYMGGCDECPATGARCADPMTLVSSLCLSMPDMPLCGRFLSFCNVAGAQFPTLCDAGSYGGLPPMKMYFHTTIREIILFREWVPGNRARYFGSCLAIILMGIVLTALRCGRVLLEIQWKGTSMSRCMCRERARIEIGAQMLQAQAAAKKAAVADTHGCCAGGGEGVAVTGAGTDASASIAVGCPVHKGAAAPPTLKQLQQNALRAIMTGLVYTLELALMLIAMTFNVGYFFCVVGGSMLGTLLFGHMSEQARMVVRRDPGGSNASAATAAAPVGKGVEAKGMGPWPILGGDVEQPPAALNNSCCCSEGATVKEPSGRGGTRRVRAMGRWPFPCHQQRAGLTSGVHGCFRASAGRQQVAYEPMLVRVSGYMTRQGGFLACVGDLRIASHTFAYL
eukprot:jgi/Mesvir1/5213/Mv15343-RA.1